MIKNTEFRRTYSRREKRRFIVPVAVSGTYVPGRPYGAGQPRLAVGRDRAEGYSGPGSLPRVTNTWPFPFCTEKGAEINLFS